MDHDLRLAGKGAGDRERLYKCAHCGQRVRVVAPVLFADYGTRYGALLAEAAKGGCPGRTPASGTDDGSSCSGVAGRAA